ncbi:hypothetical protein SDC9_176866 [bioreactor metagenome]|uniref:Uncharacterized protein n=1 Tax=bioreactor metagenome TaxID=1076179 RepID=A0A645H0L7_9ZZZZ
MPEKPFDGDFTVNFPVTFGNLGLITGIGSVPAAKPPQPGVIRLSPAAATKPGELANKTVAALWSEADQSRIAASVTGELRLDAGKRTFAVKTPRSESVTLGEGSLSAGTLSASNAEGWQTAAAISLDGKPLRDSGSILVIHLTNTANSGLTFTNETRTIVPETGKLPILIRKGSVELSFAVDRPFRVTALRTDGGAYGEVKGEFRDGRFRFTADTTLFPGGVMAYHLTR